MEMPRKADNLAGTQAVAQLFSNKIYFTVFMLTTT